VFASGDGNGFYRRIYLTMGCDQLLNLVTGSTGAISPLAELVTGFNSTVRGILCPP
jgi:hypothetical protein